MNTYKETAAPHTVEDSDAIDLLKYWQIIKNRRWVLIGVTLTVMLLSLVLSLLATRIYRATTVMQIERDNLQILGKVEGVMPTETGYRGDDFYPTQYALLSSRSMAERVAQDLKLDSTVLYSKRLEKVGENLPPAQRIIQRKQALTDLMLKSLRVEPLRNSRLVKIHYGSPDPRLSAQIASAWGDAFIASSLERRVGASSYARKYLEDRLAQIKARLEDSEKELVGYAEQEKIVSLGDKAPSLSAQSLGDLNAALAKAQDDRIRAESAWNQAAIGNGAAIPEVVSNVSVQNMREERAKVAAQHRELLRTFKPDYPDVRRLAAQINQLDHEIATSIGNVRGSIRARYEAAKSQETMLRNRIEALRSDVLDLDNRSIQYNILKREAETNRALYEGLLQRYKEIGVAGNIGANNIFVVDRAEVPIKPFKPNIPRNLALGLVLGLLLGALLTFAVHFVDQTVHAPADLENVSQLPVLGVIPRLEKGVTAATASADLRSAFSEAYRSTRTALQFATSHGLPQQLFVTSPSPSEGKSTTAVELARNIAQLGKRVLLLDMDLRKPAVHKMLNLDNARGISNVLAGASAITDVVHSTQTPGLSVVTSGPIPPNPPELLAGDRFQQLLDQMRELYDVVVIDGPPVIGLADAPLLATRAEATLLVAAAGDTKREALRGALRRMQGVNAHVLGLLLTRHNARKSGGYGYGNYQYYSYGDNSKS